MNTLMNDFYRRSRLIKIHLKNHKKPQSSVVISIMEISR